MDDSLSDFQDTKKSCSGPKNTTKPKNIKAKRAPKRIQGQTDIRTALKPKTNELETFTKDFDNVCKKAGIDVDSEQLQLAVALSKSLQNTPSPNEDSNNSQCVLTQATRIRKIRTTLQEYGFKVPEIKITTINNRKVKKYRKNYKLTSTCDKVRQQIIANKYSHIVFNAISHSEKENSESVVNNISLYYLATNITYDTVKLADIFYVDNLIEKSMNTCNLLRDWSEIPGRPVSPNFLNPIKMNFSEIECSQEELDVVLSGTLKSCKNIIYNKTATKQHDLKINFECENECEDVEIMKNNEGSCTVYKDMNVHIEESIFVAVPGGSCSPDIFDEDASSIFDNSTHKETNNALQDENSIKPELNDIPEDIDPLQNENSVKFELNKMPEDIIPEIDEDSIKSELNDDTEDINLLQDENCINDELSGGIPEDFNPIQVEDSIKFELKDLSEDINPLVENSVKCELNNLPEDTNPELDGNSIKSELNDDTEDINLLQDDNSINDELSSATPEDFNPVQDEDSMKFELNDLSEDINPLQDENGVKFELNNFPEDMNPELDKNSIKSELNDDTEDINPLQDENSINDELNSTPEYFNPLQDDSIKYEMKYLSEDINPLQDENIVKLELNDAPKDVNFLQDKSSKNVESYGAAEHIYPSQNENDKHSELYDTPKVLIDLTENESFNMTTKKTLIGSSQNIDFTKLNFNDFMDLTQCVSVQSRKNEFNYEIPKSQLSQPINITTRKSNDFMEITDCVTSCSQPLSISSHIDHNGLQNINKDTKHCIKLDDCVSTKDTESILTNDYVVVDLTENSYNPNECSNLKAKLKDLEADQSLDLTQSSNSSDDLPLVSLMGTKNDSGEDTIILDVNDYLVSKRYTGNKVDTLDLTQDMHPTNHKNETSYSQSFYGEYAHKHKDHIKNKASKDSQCEKTDFNNDSFSHEQFMPTEHFTKTNKNVSSTKSIDGEISDIDLTQDSNMSDDKNSSLQPEIDHQYSISTNSIELCKEKTPQSCNTLGKRDDVSIDYDEISNNGDNEENETPNSVLNNLNDDNFQSNDPIANSSQTSETFKISDQELYYSLYKSQLEMPGDNFLFGGVSVMDELSNGDSPKKSVSLRDYNSETKLVTHRNESTSSIVNKANNNIMNEISPIKHKRIREITTPQKSCNNDDLHRVTTPKNSEMIIKTNNITPMPDYEAMSMSKLHKELDKFGLKRLKRKQAIKILTHIYNQTHPLIEHFSEELPSTSKKRKLNNDHPSTSYPKQKSPRKILNSGKERVLSEREKEYLKKLTKVREVDSESDDTCKGVAYEVSSEVPVIKNIKCSPDDWVFQKKEKTKLHTCRVPLHVSFHNYVSSRRKLRESILCYEPVNIDVIHRDLVGYGHRYDPKDLLRFLDKKCITVKTADNDQRNNRR